ncbi:MAG: hypothetical protein L0211_04750 [Planctomycetaceae bacterium]|nr:hypothetical protein [Planctomycetaceae bacterium]
MSTLTHDSHLPVVLPSVGATDGNRREDLVASRVEQALFSARPIHKGVERRSEERYPYPYPIYLTPLAAQKTHRDETIVVIGRQLSLHGVDFYHREPIPHARVIASLNAHEQGWIGLLLELTWCRFNRHGWYDNGGRFLAVMDSPLEIERRTSG